MDRNVVTATVLIAVIMFVWLWWIAPSPDQLSNTEPPITDTAAVAGQLPDEVPDEQRATRAVPVDSAFAAAQQGEEQFVTVETGLYTARFSTKGGTPVSFQLKEYKKFDQETPVELVAGDEAGALGLVFTTPSNHVVDTRSFFFDSPAAGQTVVVADEPVSIVFEAQLGGGSIRQTYTFTPDEYDVALHVEQQNASTFATEEGYEIVWNGGIPLTEGNPETEAQASGAFARSGGETESVELNSDAYEEKRLSGTVAWAAVKSKYFTSVIIPSGQTRGAELIGERMGETDSPTLWEDYSISVLMPPAAPEGDAFNLYIGPMEFYRISDYGIGLYDMVDYGWDAMEWMTRPLAKFVFIPTFTFLSQFIANWGLVIIVFACLIKIVLYPLTKSSYKSMARMRELQPKMEAIKEKYGDNPQKQQEAMMKMYRETGINPLGGCLPMLLQYPILIALWMFLPSAIEIRQQGFLWANDLSAPDAILNLPFTIPLYGNFVAGFTLLMGLSMIVQMKIQMTPSSSNAQAKVLTYVMPLMLFVFFNRLASGLSLYYLVYNIVTAIQQKYINSHIEKLKDEPGTNGQGGRKAAAASKRRDKKPSGKRIKS